MILLLGGEKGGTGKSTVAVNLAVWLARQGTDVVLIDTDIQATASHFVDRRNALDGAPKVHCAEKHGNVYDTVRDLAKRYQQVIVDAGGRDSEELRTALVAAHLVYCPLKASQPDIETSVHMNQLVKLARGMNPILQARLLISMGSTNPVVQEAADAREILGQLTEFTLSDVIVRERKAYRDAMIEGRGVVELSNEKATAEIAALAREIYQNGGAT
ncbi:MAG: division plane positioning ATPase MipZ [Azonexus sp.]